MKRINFVKEDANLPVATSKKKKGSLPVKKGKKSVVDMDTTGLTSFSGGYADDNDDFSNAYAKGLRINRESVSTLKNDLKKFKEAEALPPNKKKKGVRPPKKRPYPSRDGSAEFSLDDGMWGKTGLPEDLRNASVDNPINGYKI